MHFTASEILLKNFEQVSVVVFRGPTHHELQKAIMSVSRKKRSTADFSKQAGCHTTSYKSCRNT